MPMNPGRLLDLFDLWDSEGPSPNLVKTLIRVISDKSLKEFAGCVMEWDERAEAAENVLEEVEYKLKEMTVRRNIAEARLKDVQTQLSNALSRCRDAESLKISLKEEVRDLRGKSKNIERHNNDLRSETKKHKILIRDLNNKEATLQKENGDLRDELKSSRDMIANLTSSNKDLQKSLSSSTIDMQHERRRNELKIIEIKNRCDLETKSLLLKHDQTMMQMREDANKNESINFERYRDAIQALEIKHLGEITELKQSMKSQQSAPFSLFYHPFPDASTRGARPVLSSIEGFKRIDHTYKQSSCLHDDSWEKLGIIRDEVRECSICEDAKATVTLSPCGHKEMCVSCAYRWMQTRGGHTCPTCRTEITSWS